MEEMRGIDHEQSRKDRLRKLDIKIQDLTREVEHSKLLSEAFDQEVEREGQEFEKIRGGEMKVTEQMRTSCDRVFAVGDVNGLTLLDSAAVAQARVAVETILGRMPAFPLDGFRDVSIRILGQLPSAGTKMKQAGLGLT